MTYEQVRPLKPEAFKRFCGAQVATFSAMKSVLEQQQQEKRKPGRPAKLSLEDQVLLALQYWRKYRTYFHSAQNWNINDSTALRIVRHVEQILIRSGQFRLPGKKVVVQSDCVLEGMVVDVTESPIKHPKKPTTGDFRQETAAYLEVTVIGQSTHGAILCTAHGKGRVHDFRLFKTSQVRLAATIELLRRQRLPRGCKTSG